MVPKDRYLMMRTSLMSFRSTFIGCIIMCLAVSAKAQLLLENINYPITPKANLSKRFVQVSSIADTLQLPFFDDFTFEASIPDTSRWPNNQTTSLTRGYAINPPSIGVATFNGINLFGNPHFTNTEVSSPADSLVSAPIDLSGEDASDANALIFYFRWQIAGLWGDRPDTFDSLKLFFLDSEAKWQKVWSQGNSAELDTTLFYPEIIDMDALEASSSSTFYHSGFKFKFMNYANPSGAFDQWHVDYIYLGRPEIPNFDNNPVSFLDDRTIVSIAKSSPLTDYTAVPLSQFITAPQDYITTEYNFTAGSLKPGNTTDNTNITYQLLDSRNNILVNNDSVFVDIDLRESPLTNRSIPLEAAIIPNYSGVNDQDSLYLTSKFTFTKTDQPDLAFLNDTVTTTTLLSNYFAYDDGSAERSIKLDGTLNRLAIKFELKEKDTLTALDIYFPYTKSSASGALVNLFVWRSLGDNNESSEDVAYQQFNATVTQPGLNIFTRFELNEPVVLEAGTFYVGYQQQDNRVVPVGYDRNTNALDKLYFSADNRTWELVNDFYLPGSVMFRPVFAKVSEQPNGLEEETASISSVYPNPAKNSFTVESEAIQLNILSLHGQYLTAYSLTGNPQHKQFLKLPGNLANGMYLLEFIHRKGKRIQRLIIQP